MPRSTPSPRVFLSSWDSSPSLASPPAPTTPSAPPAPLKPPRPRSPIGHVHLLRGRRRGYALGALVAVALLGSFGFHGLVILIIPAALAAGFIYTELGRVRRPHRTRRPRVATGEIAIGPFALVVLVTLLRFWAFNSVFQFISIWYDELGYTREFYGPLLTTIIVAGIVGTLAGGVLADRVGQRRFVTITLLASIPALLHLRRFPRADRLSHRLALRPLLRCHHFRYPGHGATADAWSSGHRLRGHSWAQFCRRRHWRAHHRRHGGSYRHPTRADVAKRDALGGGRHRRPAAAIPSTLSALADDGTTRLTWQRGDGRCRGHQSRPRRGRRGGGRAIWPSRRSRGPDRTRDRGGLQLTVLAGNRQPDGRRARSGRRPLRPLHTGADFAWHADQLTQETIGVDLAALGWEVIGAGELPSPVPGEIARSASYAVRRLGLRGVVGQDSSTPGALLLLQIALVAGLAFAVWLWTPEAPPRRRCQPTGHDPARPAPPPSKAPCPWPGNRRAPGVLTPVSSAPPCKSIGRGTPPPDAVPAVPGTGWITYVFVAPWQPPGRGPGAASLSVVIERLSGRVTGQATLG